MEQTKDQNTNMEINAGIGATKKQGKGMMFGMIACAVLAIGGIGFGIYEMSQVKTAKQQIADLKIEVKKDDGSTTTIETDKIEVKEADKTVVITDSAKTREDGYFYFDGWGIKVKLTEAPLGFLYDRYAKDSTSSQGQYKIWGGTYKGENTDYFPSYYPSNTNYTPAITLQRYLNDFASSAEIYGKYSEVYKDDTYTYYAVMTTGLELINFAESDRDNVSHAVSEFIQNSGFMDAANYSAI